MHLVRFALTAKCIQELTNTIRYVRTTHNMHSRRRIPSFTRNSSVKAASRYTSMRAVWEKLISSDKGFYRSSGPTFPPSSPNIPVNRLNLPFSSAFHSRPFNLAPRINRDFSQIIEILRPYSSPRWYGQLKGHKRSGKWNGEKREIENARLC